MRWICHPINPAHEAGKAALMPFRASNPIRAIRPVFRTLLLGLILLLQVVGYAHGAERVLKADIRHRPPEMIVDGQIFAGPLKEIMEEAAAQLDARIEWRSVPFFESLKGLQAGTVDIVPRTIRTPERETFISFLGPISTQRKEIQFLVRDGQESSIQSYGDLHKLTVGVKKDTSYFAPFDKDIAIARRPSVGGDYALARLFLDGGVDTVAVLDRAAMESALAGLGFKGHAYARYQHVRMLENYFGLSRESPHAALFPELNRVLKGMAESGRVEEIYAKHRIEPQDAASPAVKLEAGEAAWLKAHPTVTVGNETDWPPFDFAEKGEAKGLSIDMIRLAAQKVGLGLTFVNGYTWAELMVRFKAGKIDILPAVYLTPERRTFMRFTSAYTANSSVLVVRTDRSDITTLEHLNGKHVAVIAGFATADMMKKRFTGITRLPVSNVQEGLKAVSFKKVDAFIGSLGVINHVLDQMVIPNLRLVGEVWLKKPEETQLHMGVLKGQETLRDILQKGLDAIDKEELRTLRRDWIPAIDNAMPNAEKVKLTAEERAWLKAHKTLRLGDDFSWAPFSFLDEQGRYSGIAAGYAEALTTRLGVTMKPVTGLSWKQVLQGVKAGRIDILPAVAHTPEREEFLNFSKPYISLPVVVATRKGSVFVDSLSDLVGYRVGVVKDYITDELMARKHPSLQRVQVATLAEGLRALNSGKLDAFVDNLGSITYEIDRQRLEEIKIAAPTPYRFPLAFGVRKDWPELVPILDKALNTIDEKERSFIKNSWMAVEFSFGFDMKTILTWALPVGGGALLVIIFVVVWNRRLGREIIERERAEAALKEEEKRLQNAYDIISASIDYAAHIQQSVLPDEQLFARRFQDYLIIWEPRDRVGGDIYWCVPWGDGTLLILADCTGHGVPGAFVTLIATGALERALEEVETGHVTALIQRMHQRVQRSLNQHEDVGDHDDGLELGICYINADRRQMTFVGARFSLFCLQGDGVVEIRGDKRGIGYRGTAQDAAFTPHRVPVEVDGGAFYMATDGLIDQVGGPRRRMFGKRRFKRLLLEVQGQEMAAQKEAIVRAHAAYQGDENRRDDLSAIGFCL
ncbi:MAG: transporter substrate-binding domain-containing protein [Magnetococcales bacterium]|nr:transporter substrate-binding domain-containing protein [Magnetococcales bacterium]